MTNDQRYPALLNDRFTPIYDFFARLLLPEMQFKRALIAHARIAPGQRVLDLGAGTGTLSIMIKQTQPESQVVGLDGDPKVLTIAREKASRSVADIDFELGNAAALPYSDQSFDRVLSTLVMSLLNREQKILAIRDSYRVLKGGGELHIADFSQPHTWWGRVVAPRMRRFEPIADNLDGLLPAIFRSAGFTTQAMRFATIFGTLNLVWSKPYWALSYDY
jgi:ubiquinone/menaquinone biosynthesis C-methylase UbiE